MPKVSEHPCSSTVTNVDFVNEENTYLRTKNRELAKALAEMKANYNTLSAEKNYLQRQIVDLMMTNRKLIHDNKVVNRDAVETLTMVGKLSEFVIKIMNNTKVNTEPSVIVTEDPNHWQNSARHMVSGHFIQNPTVSLQRLNIDNLNEIMQRSSSEGNHSSVNSTPMDQLVEEPENSDSPENDDIENSDSPENDDIENNDPNVNDCSAHNNLTTVQEIDEDNLSQTIVQTNSVNNTQQLSPVLENVTSRKRSISPYITRRNKKMNVNKSPFSMSSYNSSLSNNFGSSEVSLSVTGSDTSTTPSTTPTRRKNNINVANKKLEETFNPSHQSTSTPYKCETNKKTDKSLRNSRKNMENCKVILTRLPLPLISSSMQDHSSHKSDNDDDDDSTLIETTNTYLNKSNLRSSAGKKQNVKKTHNKTESSINSTRESQGDEISINMRPKRNAAPKSMKEPSLNTRMRRP